VRDGAGGEALVEDFGADEAGCANEDDFGHGCGLVAVYRCVYWVGREVCCRVGGGRM
jgi:hypothetical protein